MIRLIIIAAMVIELSSQTNSQKVIPLPSRDVQTVEFCELFQKAASLKDKEVRVRALYRTNFEESSLYSPVCYAPMLTWVEFNPTHRSCTTKKMQKKLDQMQWGKSVDVIFIGRFETKGQYGHMDMYPTKFVVTCVWRM